jgi:hypothetical protein
MPANFRRSEEIGNDRPYHLICDKVCRIAVEGPFLCRIRPASDGLSAN